MRRLSRHATLRQLQIFKAVGRLKSFTRAAEELHLTQSTVSTQIKHLTDILDTPLLEYVGKQVKLTEAGEHLYHACTEVFRTLDGVNTAVADLNGLKIGHLSVSAISTAKYFVPEVLGAFALQYPDIHVDLQILNLEGVLERLRTNQDDIYIIGHRSSTELEIESVPFAPNPLCVMASRKHPLAKSKKPVALKELAQQHLIMRETGSGIRFAVEQLFLEHGLQSNTRMVLSSNEAIKHALIGRLGISVLSLHSILGDGKRGPLTIVKAEHFPIHRQWHVVYPKQKELSILARTFLQFLHRQGQQLAQKIDNLLASNT